ncbi:MAG: OmpH family outer membrane protein [Phycisphaerales bacterium]
MKITAPRLIAGAALAALAAAAAFPDRPARVASVDVAKAFVGLDEQKTLEGGLKSLGERMAAEKDRMSRELQDLNAELESYKPGTPPYNETLKKVEAAVGAMRAQDQFGQLKLEAERATALRELYARIRAASEAVAKDSNIDYVVVNDSLVPVEPAGLAATQQQLNTRRFLWANPEMDITDAVIARANADFKAKGGTVPAAPAGPAAQPAPAPKP